MNKKLDNLIKSQIPEHDTVDPLTLTNLILNHSMIDTGYDWTTQAGKKISVEKIFANAPKEVDRVGEFKLDEAAKISKKKKITRKPSLKKEPKEAPPTTNQVDTKQPEIEVNTTDPNIMSTDPGFNMCPAYLNGVCRVNGKPCAYSNLDYKDCGIYTLAKSGVPSLFEIPPGKENDMSYIFGIKDK